MSLECVQGGWKFSGHKGKGGSSQAAPVEARDSLHSVQYAKIKLLLSEGEIEGPADGLKSVYLDNTPIQNNDGSLNFSGLTVDFRNGTQDQEYIKGFPASEATIGVGVELRSDAPYTHGSSNTQLSAMRVAIAFQGLSSANTSTGDINGYSIQYAIDISIDGSAFTQILQDTVSGKTTSTYVRAHRVDLPRSITGWVIRVRRLTPNANSGTIQDTTIIQSVTEVIDGKQRHPMWAVAGITLDASQFSSIPTVAVDCKGIRMKVPSNYDAVSRTYSGVWDGTFKISWTDNPAWIFYDLITKERYGLGERIPEGWVDRYSLYQIAQYCDQPVSDGKGGTEPRFSCNVYLQVQADAYRVLQDLATVFRGITYWGSGLAIPVADMPRDADYTYNNSNVIEGMFNYSSTPRKTRYTSALVSWNDPDDMGRQKVEAVDNLKGILRFGVQEVEISAFGCTSQAMAQRVGKWALESSLRETRLVNFSVGLDGAVCTPGQIINVADSGLSGRRISGRISHKTLEYITVNGEIVTVQGDSLTVSSDTQLNPSLTSITVDSNIVASAGDILSVTLPSGVVEKRTIQSISGRVITVTVPFSEAPEPESVWLIESSELVSQKYRIVSVTEKDGLIFDLVAIQYDESKFDAIDYNTRVEAPPITVIPPSVQPPPTNLVITQYEVISQGISTTSARFEWDGEDTAVEYDAQWKRDNSDWVQMSRTSTTSIEVGNAYRGQYLFRVRSRNAAGIYSAWSTSILTEIDGILSAPPTVTNLLASGIVFGIDLKWGFPNTPNIIEKTEIYYSQTNDRNTAIKLGDFPYPQTTHSLVGLSAGSSLFFWARSIDKNGTVGVWYPTTNGVNGQASSDAGDILGYLSGQITETQLSTQLLEIIESGGGSAVELEALITELAAMYSIKTQMTVDGRTYIAGIGVGVENNSGIIESQVLVAASRFAILDPNTGESSLVSPFIVQNGQVFINSLVVQQATIEEALVGSTMESLAKAANGEPILSLNFNTGSIRVRDDSGTLRVAIGNLA